MPLARYAAVATLFLVPAVVVEFLTGNMTLAVFADPISLVILFGSYGSGAVLARELTLRWQKGFASTLILGAVYGMFNEAMASGGFFDPHFYAVVGNGLENYGRWGGVNVVWAVEITVFHAVFSIAVPIIIVDALFPAFAHRPLLGNKSLLAFFFLLVMVTAVQRVILTSRQPPVNTYAFIFVIVLMIFLTLIARFFPAFFPSNEAWRTRKAPSNRFLFLSALLGSILWIVLIPRTLSFIRLPIVDILTISCVLFLVSRLLLSLAHISRRQRVAMAAGAEGVLVAHAISSANFVPAAITLALLIVAWIRSGETAEGRAPV
ncbi:MAG: hypothetical protein ACREDT_09555 [Methylocella sp.]